MTYLDDEWLDLYDKHVDDIPDHILDEADAVFGIEEGDDPPTDWYLWVIKSYYDILE